MQFFNTFEPPKFPDSVEDRSEDIKHLPPFVQNMVRQRDNQRQPMAATGARANQAMGNLQNMIEQYQQAPKFDANSIGRGIDQSYFNSLALQPGVASNLKGMGVGAAEGQQMLMQSLPMMQARAEGKANLGREQHQADQMYLMNLMNMLMQQTQTGLQYEGINNQHLDRQANINLNR